MPVPPSINFTKTSDFKTLYVNYVQTFFTPFDMTLLVGQAVSVDPKAAEVEHKARIVMHPAEAKILSALLSQSVEQYEKQYGDIPIDKVRHTLLKRDEQAEGV
jgi:hypothetical protein